MTELELKEIALHCNYPSLSHFPLTAVKHLAPDKSLSGTHIFLFYFVIS